MKTIIAGSRDATYGDVLRAVNEYEAGGGEITEVVSGKARGADFHGEQIAQARGIHVQPFLADWAKHGKKAGPIRNRQMAAYGEALIAVWDGESRGTLNMIQEAEKRGLPVFIHRFTRP